jgi:hypothetical protein
MSVPERSFLAWVALVFVALASSSAMAQSASQSDDTSGEPRTARPKHKPVNLEIEDLKAVGQPARRRKGAELYYNYALFKGLWLTPDIQLYFDPALRPGCGPAAVLTFRTTALF